MIESGKLIYRPKPPVYQIVFESEDGTVRVRATTLDHEEAIEWLAERMEEEGEVNLNGSGKKLHGGPYKARFTIRYQVTLKKTGRNKWKTETVTLDVGSKNLTDARDFVLRHINAKYPSYKRDEQGELIMVRRKKLPKGTEIWPV